MAKESNKQKLFASKYISKICSKNSACPYMEEDNVNLARRMCALIEAEILQNSDFEIKTIRMGEYMDGYENYEKLISDHLPVLLSF